MNCLPISVACLLALVAGCTTLAPRPVRTTQASFDSNAAHTAQVQNSGIISADATGFLVTPHFIERYDALLANFGKRLTPARKPGDRTGITPAGINFRMNAETMLDFDSLNAIRKAEEAP